MKQADVPLFQQEGTTCCYAKADKFWVKDGDGIPWEMYFHRFSVLRVVDPLARAGRASDGFVHVVDARRSLAEPPVASGSPGSTSFRDRPVMR